MRFRGILPFMYSIEIIYAQKFIQYQKMYSLRQSSILTIESGTGGAMKVCFRVQLLQKFSKFQFFRVKTPNKTNIFHLVNLRLFKLLITWHFFL